MKLNINKNLNINKSKNTVTFFSTKIILYFKFDSRVHFHKNIDPI